MVCGLAHEISEDALLAGNEVDVLGEFLPVEGVDAAVPRANEIGLQILYHLRATASQAADGRRRLITAEVAIDGVSQGPVAEALVTVG